MATLAMEHQLLYRDLARYYDLIYSFKDYQNEVKRIVELVEQFKRSAGNDLLEVACGTGRHLEYLKEHFRCVGVDLNDGMLGVARKRLPEIELRQADMVHLDLGRRFDVIVCLFSSIGYVKTYDYLQMTLDGFARHLQSGGVTIIEPWFTKDAHRVGTPHMTTYEADDIKIARLSVSGAQGDISTMDMHYLVAEAHKGVTYFSDRHELGMFDTARTLEIMRSVGLVSVFLRDELHDDDDRGLLVGVKAE